jgi:regulator of sirC expression with transglutaminase-like and TPR domain
MRRQDVLTALEAIGRQPDDMIDLAEAALLLAALDRPGADLGPYRRHLAELVADIADAATGVVESIDARVAALRLVLAGKHGYGGDRQTYDDLANANLISVIDRRRGLPVALGILYVHAARAQGWRAAGINFPGHFLVALEDEEERVLIDPFEGGVEMDLARLRRLTKASIGQEAELRPEFHAAMTNRGVLLRLQSNIKKRVRDAGDFAAADRALEAMLAIAPEIPDLWREAAELKAETGELRAALGALDRFVALAGDDHRDEAMSLRRKFSARLN